MCRGGVARDKHKLVPHECPDNMFAGVAAELVFFPALLASPLGRVFRPRTRSDDDSDDSGRGDEEPKTPDSPPTLRIESGRESKRIALF